MKIFRVAALLGAMAACPAVFAQPIDFSLALFDGGVPVTGGDVVLALVVSADLWTDAKEPFVVRVALPPGLAATAVCSGETHFDAAARVFTWTDRLDNPGLAQRSCPVLLRIDSAAVPGTAYHVLASLTTSAPDRDPSNNVVARVLTVLPASDLSVASSASPRMIKPGETLTYTFAVTNHGPQDAHNVSLDDEVSPHLSVVSYEQTGGPSARVGVPTVIGHLPVGETATFRLVTRAKTDFESATIRNRATAQSANVDLQQHNNVAEVWMLAGPHADLSIRSERAGDAVVLHVKNDGPDTVNDVAVTHYLIGGFGSWNFIEEVKFASVTPTQGKCSAPEERSLIASPPGPPFWAVECTAGALAPGASMTITVAIEKASNSGPFHLTSSVSPAQNDPRPENNTATVPFPVPPRRRSIR